ncbi:glutathione-dependent disulfide-bond oxidoreductase [Moraxella sp. ZY210820]|uniref:glutathione-dependent disulfide-bond oxidoreductase n=1 Tax=unclassified Moraxella TaxID=2685852 RepID=UPI0027301A3D|nr:glutathione-dependent disulfide-bond oxidoreductase [Moraxella sp. ZY210820]WLF84250.1 glutathione-dependent disulfide-bond oxidoreductase [Moraxella sp. ZY210820]
MSYIPPKIWDYEQVKNQNGGKFGGTNRPTAGATHTQTLPKGEFDYQLYSLNTPNGIKVNIILEELKALNKIKGYDAFKIDIMAGDQFGSDFVAINPNSKIPALVDYSQDTPISIFESGAILLYLAQKYQQFLPSDIHKNAQTLSWLMWQMGSAPFLGGGFGHFYAYAPQPIEYAINRYAMETKRQLDVLNQHLATHQFMVGDDYTVADMAIFPWYGRLCLGELYVSEHYNAFEFLSAHEYTHIIRWANQLKQRPAVQQALQLELKSIK